MILIKTPTAVYARVERLEMKDEKDGTAELAIFQSDGYILRPIKDRLSTHLLTLLLNRVYQARGSIAIEFVEQSCSLDQKWTLLDEAS
jgi:hypothetical protein